MAGSLALDPVLIEKIEALIAKHTAAKVASLESQIAALAEKRTTPQGLTLIIFSGDLDKVLAAFTLATGAAAMGLQVSMFFTFWGLVALKRRTVFRGKGVIHTLLAAMLPASADRLRTSRLNLCGVGPRLFGFLMRKHGVERLQGLMVVARESNVRMVACQMSMELMGITHAELMAGVECGGVATCLGTALESGLLLFI
jgi:peroxiredoxin family protein